MGRVARFSGKLTVDCRLGSLVYLQSTSWDMALTRIDGTGLPLYRGSIRGYADRWGCKTFTGSSGERQKQDGMRLESAGRSKAKAAAGQAFDQH